MRTDAWGNKRSRPNFSNLKDKPNP